MTRSLLGETAAGLEKAELVERAPSPRDPRRQSITLTGHGRTAADLLDERSRDSVGALLDRVPARDRPRLTAAMRTIQDILSQERPPRAEDVLLRPPGPGDLGWIVQRNASIYAAEFGWNAEYEALVARIVADFAEHHDPRLERVWVAELDGRPVGGVMCVRDTHGEADQGGTGPEESTGAQGDTGPQVVTGPGGTAPEDARTVGPPAVESSPGTARLRLLLVEPDARGLGIGDRLVRACVEFAHDAGYDDLVLWTNDILHSARRIYLRHGFTLTAERAHHSFGVDLTGQDWHLRLRTAEDGPGAREAPISGEDPAPRQEETISRQEGSPSGRRG